MFIHLFFSDCDQLVNWTGFSRLFFFSVCDQSANCLFPLKSQIPLPVGSLFEQLCHSCSDSGRQAIVRMDRGTCLQLQRCRDVHEGCHGLANMFLSPCQITCSPSFLTNPLPPFSLSISPVTKGVFLFKGPQKPLGTQSENCYNWWRRGEAGRERGLYCFRVQKDMTRKLLS